MPDVIGNNPALVATSTTGTSAPASGTGETWSVVALSSAWNPVGGVISMSIQDVALPGEIIRITASSGAGDTSISVTRGADGTTPVAHASGATYVSTVVSSALNSKAPIFNPTDPQYGALGDGTTDDSAAMQAAITAAEAVGGELVLPPGRFRFASQVTISDTCWYHGSGLGTIIEPDSGVTPFLISNPTLLKFSDLQITGGAFAMDVEGAANSHFNDLYISGQTSGGVYVNGDASTEQHWTDVVMSGVQGIGFDYERTNNADVGGLYMDRVRIIDPITGSTHAFKFNSTSGSPPNINLFMTQCIGDNYGDDAFVVNNCNIALVDEGWFTCSSSAASGKACVHLTAASAWNFTNSHTVQPSSSHTAFEILCDSGTNNVLVTAHQFLGSNNTALGLSGAGSGVVLGEYTSVQATLTDAPLALTNITQFRGPRQIWTNGGGGAGSAIGLGDANSPSSPFKYIRNAGGALQVLNGAFSAAIFALSDAGIITTPVVTTNSTLDNGSGDLTTGGQIQAGGAGVKIHNNGAVEFLANSGGSIWGGNGVPSSGLGADGDYYFRKDGSSSTTHLYFKASGAWSGVA